MILRIKIPCKSATSCNSSGKLKLPSSQPTLFRVGGIAQINLALLDEAKGSVVVNAERSASPRTDAHFASAQGEGATIIAANINLSEYENISHSRDV